MIFPSILDTVGKTPLVELKRVGRGLGARLAAKLESRNPCGSVKDRIGVAMIADAEQRGILEPGSAIVEATSGNTGIALAFVCAARGYRLVLTMPERMSRERIQLLRYLGAEVVLTPGSLMKDAVEKAKALAKEIPKAVELQQFRNPANPQAHRMTTGPEIWKDSEGKVDVFISGVGTGGTITGVGEVLKHEKRSVKVVAVEPASAAVLSGGPVGNHLIQGIGAGFVPEILNRKVVDEVVPITEDEAFAHARRLAREEGISAGISSGAILAAALKLAARPEHAGQLIVFMLCDGGEKYTSTPLIEEMIGPPPPRPSAGKR
ncbi:MAG: cysteine synthase A [Myxococcaceae bacterium]|nr:cysteine synthase A [Myxococcaceae bacterium]